MFKKQTAFILGAGASAEFGLPVGLGLASTIKDKMDIRFEFSQPIGTGDHDLYDEVLNKIGRHRSNELFAACSKIRNGISLSNSIDDFLDLHQDDELVRLMGKAAIVKSIVEAERESMLMPDLDTGGPDLGKANDTWLLKLVRMIGTNCPRELFFEKVSFVTFNYDRTLEYFLGEAIKQLYALSDSQGQSLLAQARIYHPYGSIAPLTGQGALPFGGLRGYFVSATSFAGRISTYTEEIREEKQLANIRTVVGMSEQVVFIGFGFHQQNIKLLEASLAEKPVYATAHRMSYPNQDVVKNRISAIFSPQQRSDARENNIELANTTAGEFMDQFRFVLMA